jgi:hypothetical protein
MMTMCSMGFNNGLFAFPIVMGIWGGEAVRLLAIFDVGNGLTVLGFNYVVAGWFGGLALAAQGEGGKAAGLQLREALRRVGRALVTSVPMVTFIFALVLNLTGWRFPTAIDRAVGSVADANGALALLVLGIFQSLRVRREDLPIILRVLGLRYVLGGIIAVAAILLLGSTPLYRADSRHRFYPAHRDDQYPLQRRVRPGHARDDDDGQHQHRRELCHHVERGGDHGVGAGEKYGRSGALVTLPLYALQPMRTTDAGADLLRLLIGKLGHRMHRSLDRRDPDTNRATCSDGQS